MKNLFVSLFLLLPFIAFTQQNSALSSGEWYKIAVSQSGVHKITYNDIESYGIDVNTVDPRHFVLYGNPAGMLPEELDADFYTDLQPMAIQVVGEEDGILNPDDYILFYGQAPDVWEVNDFTGEFQQEKNIYSLNTFYFLNISNQNVKRIETAQNSPFEPTQEIQYYDLLVSHQMDLVNPGATGKRWLGEKILPGDSLNNHLLTETNVFSDSNYFKCVVASRSTESNNIEILIDGQLVKDLTMPLTPPTSYSYYRLRSFDTLIAASGDNIDITFVYHSLSDTAEARIDYFEMNLRGDKTMTKDQMLFRSRESVGANQITEFELANENQESISVWNVTDIYNVKEQELILESELAKFRLETDKLLEFIAFNGEDYLSSEFIGRMENQNLHGMEPPELLIVTHSSLYDQANELAEFHQISDAMSVGLVTVDKIYNEFSSGSQDITAIRNFVRYLREKSGENVGPAYLLLFGDASYDYLNRLENNTNLVPTYETAASENQISSFASDQYYSLREMENPGEMQLAVGRIPVSSVEEAERAIAKIKSYYKTETMGAWELEMMFIADDQDVNRHLRDAETLTASVEENIPEMNITKTYLDFFSLEQTDQGPRYPEVNEKIASKTNDGVFYVNYLGHGGVNQLANEDILSADDLSDWTNADNLPLWVIASGQVVRFDNPATTSLGEELFLKEDAGAIAVIGLVRDAYASANLSYNMGVINNLAEAAKNGPYYRFGDLMLFSSGSGESLKWTMIGDPALRMHIAQFNVKTTTINGIAAEDFSDTISPGDRLIIGGRLTTKDEDELPIAFEGTIYLKVFAPPFVRTTLANQETSQVTDVMVQDSVLVTAMATINTDGSFEVEINLPSEPTAEYGNLKLSWYARDVEANGFFNQLVYGGEPNGLDEKESPLDFVSVFPSPFSDYININTPHSNNETVVYKVYNTMGKQVFSFESKLVNSSQQLQMTGLSSGMYILNISTGVDARNFKLIKQ